MIKYIKFHDEKARIKYFLNIIAYDRLKLSHVRLSNFLLFITINIKFVVNSSNGD